MRIKPQRPFKRLPLKIVGKLGVSFKRFKRGERNSRHASRLAHGQPFFIAFDEDVVAKGFRGCGDDFSRLAIYRDMASGRMDRALCNSQQGYCPR